MFNAITQPIKLASENLSSAALLGTAIACTIAGLIIWLAGLGMARLAAAAIGGFAGCFVAYVFFSFGLGWLALAVLVGAAFGLLFELLLSHSIGYATYGYNLIMAVLTAASGSVLAIVGMIFLLYYKGSDPLRHVNSHQKLYLTVLFAMIVFGTIEQLILCRKKTAPAVRKKSAVPATEVEPSQKGSWRNK
jgi:hypothetical protein